MTTLLVTHNDCLYHDTTTAHPESPDRLRAVLHALEREEFQYLIRDEAPLATDEQLCRVHPASHLQWIGASVDRAAMEDHVFLDSDTVVSPGSFLAARRAAGAVCHAVGAVALGEARNAFCAVRPPGHHAEPGKPMGFCLFNNVAVGAHEARVVHGLERVAVIDFDVHHGNGTQAMFEHDARLFYASTHQSPLYPGTGDAEERGVGNILNVPLAPGGDGPALRKALVDHVIPALDRFEPDLIMISAGFDGHKGDPLANLNFETDDFATATDLLCEAAERLCEGRVVSTLEGGYNLTDLADSAAAHVSALMRHS
ncbi:MAG: histone deacetylase family protein [Alphaproteobacteria bacterium]